MTRFEKALAAAAFLTESQTTRLMRCADMKNLVEAARAAPPSRVHLTPAVHELVRQSRQMDPADGVQLSMPEELLPKGLTCER